jgi:hypothetical protein
MKMHNRQNLRAPASREAHPLKTAKGGATSFLVVQRVGLPAVDIEVTIDFGRAGSEETQTHEGTHVIDDQKFLASWTPRWGGYTGWLTHGQSEFNAFKAGAEVNHEHGFGPNDDKKIWDFLRNDPNYRNVLNVPVFDDPNKFPAAVPQD